MLTALDPDPDPCDPSPASSPQRVHPASSSPLSSPPSSPSLEQQQQRRTHTSSSPSPAPSSSPSPPYVSSTKRPSPDDTVDVDVDASASSPASAAPARARSKRRRRDANADDKPWRDRRKHSSPLPPRDSSPSSKTSPSPSPPPPATSPDSDCPHPALLGLLLETLALSRASSLTQSALVRTNPALAPSDAASASAVLAKTLEWAVRAHVLGCVRSSGEALPPSYFYDPTEDPDRERGEILRCLMPRAGKRRETKKYKQYYWAPVVVGRGRTRTWDVDWEE
jgi:hypothetical protein